MPDEKFNIICFSNQLWDFPNWTNKKHVMYRLGKLGHKVMFVDPPINLGFVFLRQFFRGMWSISRLFTFTKTDKDSNVLVLTPINILPWYQITSFFHILKIKLVSHFLFKKDRKTILWVYHVQLAGLPKYLEELKYDVLVYDCVDNYDAVPEEKAFYKTNLFGEELKVQEKYLAEKSDVVFATAPGIVDKMKKYSSNVHFTPNVGDYPRFVDAKKIKEIPEALKNIKRPIVAFTGALDPYKFDLDLFKKTVEDNPNFSFVLIGQIALKDKGTTLASIGLGEYKNVHFLGQVDFFEMPKYYAGFDMYIIPYVLNDYTVGGCFPVKFHEALAVGLPTIVTDMPAYYPFRDVCYISKNYEEFSKNIQRAFDEDTPEKMKARQAVAKDNNYEGKVAKMLQLIASRIS